MRYMFHILWYWAVFCVVSAPFRKVGKKLLFVGAIGVGIWLIVGVSVYKSKHLAYETKRSSLQEKIDLMHAQKADLESLLVTHPTSRDILLSLADISQRLHDDNTYRFARTNLFFLDPNNERVRALQ